MANPIKNKAYKIVQDMFYEFATQLLVFRQPTIERND